MISALDVYVQVGSKPDVHAGRAHFTQVKGVISTTFRYDDSYLANPESFAIDPGMPLLYGSYTADGLPGSFIDASPGEWGRRLLGEAARKSSRKKGTLPGLTSPETAASQLGEVKLLVSAMDLPRHGGMRFAEPLRGRRKHPKFLSEPVSISQLEGLAKLLRASDRVIAGRATLRDIRELISAGAATLGGSRPKAPVSDGNRLLMARFPHPSDEWDVNAWEKTAFDVARLAGSPVPAATLIRIDGRQVLLVERFDREGSLLDGARLPYVSAKTLLGADAEGVSGYSALAEAMSGFVGNIAAQRKDLLRRACLSFVLNSTEDTLHGVGFVMAKGKWALAPVFGIDPVPDEGGARIEVDQLSKLASALGIGSGEAQDIMRSVAKAAARWREIAIENGCRRSEIAMFEPVIEPRVAALGNE